MLNLTKGKYLNFLYLMLTSHVKDSLIGSLLGMSDVVLRFTLAIIHILTELHIWLESYLWNINSQKRSNSYADFSVIT